MAEIEPQPVGGHQRPLLGHVRAQATAKRLVQQMGGRMVRPEGAPPRTIHLHQDRLAAFDRAARDDAEMDVQIAELLLGVADRHPGARGRDQGTGIAHLAAGLAIEG
jgi:hypothetical protein